jgi:hypothetical protein
MGGTNEKTINGLRYHEDNGNVHFHDDPRSLKFCMDKVAFVKEMKNALKDLSNQDGVINIDGNNFSTLIIGKINKAYFITVPDLLTEETIKNLL